MNLLAMDTVVVKTRLSDCLDGTRCDEEAACRGAQLSCIGEEDYARSSPMQRKKISECMVRKIGIKWNCRVTQTGKNLH